MSYVTQSSRAATSRMLRDRGPTLLAVGIALGAAAFYVQKKKRQAERAHPPLGQFIDVEGVRLHYIERGQGQPLVLFHGNGDTAEGVAMSGLLDLAAANYRVIVFDRPGYGYSERPRNRIWTASRQADLLHHALQLLGIDQAIVAGHSWGTLVALQMALKYPASVRSLVLLSGYYYPTFRPDVVQFSVPAIPIVGDLLRYTVSPLLGRLMWPALKRWVCRPAPVPAQFHAFPVWMALRPSQLRASAAEGAMLIPSAALLKKRYAELTMPVVLLAGDGDRYVNTQKHTVRLQRELPQAELHVAEGAGHMVHYIAPQQIVAAFDAAARLATSEIGRERLEPHKSITIALPNPAVQGSAVGGSA